MTLVIELSSIKVAFKRVKSGQLGKSKHILISRHRDEKKTNITINNILLLKV